VGFERVLRASSTLVCSVCKAATIGRGLVAALCRARIQSSGFEIFHSWFFVLNSPLPNDRGKCYAVGNTFVSQGTSESIIMQINPKDGRLFYKLYSALMFYVNRKLKVLKKPVADAKAYSQLSLESRVKVRDAFYAKPALLDEFMDENPARLKTDELEIVSGWKHAIFDKFYIYRYLKRYSVFFRSTDNPNKLYGVLGLADPIEVVVGPYLPILAKAALLPIKGQIIYDGLLYCYSISFGGGFRSMLNEEYKESKEKYGIITSLPFDENLLSEMIKGKKRGKK
jgi:hypothetical protein